MTFLYILVFAAVFIQKGETYTCYNAAAPPLCSTCSGGFCTKDNGCTCNSDSITTCVPTSECDSVGTNICCPAGYYWSPTDHCCTGTLLCNPSCQSDEVCNNVNSAATCGCNTTLYSGLNTSSLAPNVTCQSAIMVISLSKCLMEALGYDYTTFQLNNNSDSCINTYPTVINGITMQNIQALTQTGWCGNVVTTDTLKVYYQNVLHIGILNRTIITLNPTNISFSCSYNLSIQTNLAAALNPVINTVNISASGEGSVSITMTAYWDSQYTTPILASDSVPVGSNVYLGIVAYAGDANKFVLRAESCYATPDNNVNNVNKVAIVSGGCPANQGVTAEVQENGKSLESRIRLNSFAFQGQSLVYVTCQVRLCDTNKTCTGCNVARASDDGTALVQIPLDLSDNYSSASNTVSSWFLLVSCLLAYLSVKLF